MTVREIAWRSAAAVRIGLDRLRALTGHPRWDRASLDRVLARTPALNEVRAAVAARDWRAAHERLSAHFAASARGFPIAPCLREGVAARIERRFRAAACEARARGDRVLAGTYDLLGYRALRFAPAGALPDWHLDPLHARRAPLRFWSRVPYLDPSCGDHKIIWELNRHQHWLALGRASWLTPGDRRYRDRFITELGSWLSANPPLMGINWASMLELGFRSLSWIWALEFFADPAARDAEPWTVDLLLALDRQLAQVERNLSYYFSPNTHLLGEALALYVAGRSLPELAASARRAELGRRILIGEINRQITSDGGHAERSAHYHRYTLDFYLLALIVSRASADSAATAAFEAAVTRLADAARLLADDEGRLPHFGDDDAGRLLPICAREPDDIRDSLAIAARLTGRPELMAGQAPEECVWMLAHPALADVPEPSNIPGVAAAAPPQLRPLASLIQGPGSGALPESGYYISRSRSAHHLVIDAGPLGYRNAGHAHADALSLTLSLRGVPLLIDPGTGCYTTDSEIRDRLRSTALHNTLTIDGRSQSIPSGPFHWAHAADARAERWRTNGAFDYFEGVHDGYRPLEHWRYVLILPGDLLVVADRVDGPAVGPHRAKVHWHIDPRWRVGRLGAPSDWAPALRRDRDCGQFILRREWQPSSDESEHAGDRIRGAISVQLFLPQGKIGCLTGDPATGLGWHSPAYGRIEPNPTIYAAVEGPVPIWVLSVFGLDAENLITDVEVVAVSPAGRVAVQIRRAVSTDFVGFGPGPGVSTGPGAGTASRLVTLAGVPEEVSTSREPEPRRIWKLGDVETDARMLFYRLDPGRRRALTRLAIVDGSHVHVSGSSTSALRAPRLLPDLYLNLDSSADRDRPARAAAAAAT